MLLQAVAVLYVGLCEPLWLLRPWWLLRRGSQLQASIPWGVSGCVASGHQHITHIFNSDPVWHTHDHYATSICAVSAPQPASFCWQPSPGTARMAFTSSHRVQPHLTSFSPAEYPAAMPCHELQAAAAAVLQVVEHSVTDIGNKFQTLHSRLPPAIAVLSLSLNRVC
jgi:hypothetical protein